VAQYLQSARRRALAVTAQSRRPRPRVRFDLYRRRRWPVGSTRGVVNGALYAPARINSVGTTQGAFANPGGGLTYPTVDGTGVNWWVDVTVTDQPPGSTPTDPWTVAVTGARRAPLVSLAADWDRDGYQSPLTYMTDAVSEVTIERATTGDLPDEVSLVEGSTIAQATVTLEGRVNGYDVFELFAPYRSDSPLFRTAVVTTPAFLWIGFQTSTGRQYVQQILGHIRSVKPDTAARTVELVLLDPADLLRAPITFPACAMYGNDYRSNNHKFFVNSQAIIDFVLRRNGIYASVAPHPQAQISCTAHGWFAAEAGRSAVPRGIAAPIAADTAWVPGPFDLLALGGVWDDNAAYTEFFAREPYTPRAGNGVGMSAWIKVGTDMGVTAGGWDVFQLLPLADNTAFQFVLAVTSTGGITGIIRHNGIENGFTQPVTTTTQWQYIGLHFVHNSDGTTTIRYRVGGATSSGNVTTPTVSSPAAPFLQCTAWTMVSWSDFQVWYDPADPGLAGAWPGETPLNEADLDIGLNNMTHLPDVVNADSWTVITDVAKAEYALVGFDDAGRFAFTSRDTTNVNSGTVTETVTADRALVDLVTETSTDSVRNVITTETTAGFLDFQNIVFESQSATQFNTYPGLTTYEVDLPYGAIGTTTQAIQRVADASWTADVLWGYVVVDAYNPTVEIDPAADVTVLFAMTGDRKGTITVRNNSPNYVQFATTGGQPALRVQGYLLVLSPTVAGYNGRQGSVNTYGPRLLALDASPYRQVLDSMRPVAVRLLQQLAWPVPVIDQFTAIGNPTRRVGDTLNLVDPKGHGSIRAGITKVSRHLSAGQGLVDTLTVRPVGPPGTFILDDPVLGVLDDPTLYITP
jgi:hypothetical protein